MLNYNLPQKFKPTCYSPQNFIIIFSFSTSRVRLVIAVALKKNYSIIGKLNCYYLNILACIAAQD